MLNKIFSMKVAVALMLIFAISIGAATFIENDYGTQSARALVYNATWFELLLFYFIATVLYNIVRFRMYRKEKWGQLTLHSAFLLIAVGALMTRYVGYEGILHIREGQSSRLMVSDRMMLNIALKSGKKIEEYQRPLFLSSMTKNPLHESLEIDGKKVQIDLLDYLPAAKESIVPLTQGGTTLLEMKISSGGRGEDVVLAKGNQKDMGNFVLSFEGKGSNKPTLFLLERNGTLQLKSPVAIETLSMTTRQRGELPPGVHPFKTRTLYQVGGNSMVLRKVVPHAKLAWKSVALKPGGRFPQMLVMKVTHNGKSETVRLRGRRAQLGAPKIVNFKDMGVKLSYGAKVIPLPFSIHLKDFELKRYPGSMSPSEYSSYVTVIDKERNVTMPYHIYMNHVLDYRGFRFFQSSYDPDEGGTVLSVNHDPGTWITYLGYLMLAIGFLWSYLSPKGRFQSLRRKLRKLQSAPALALLLSTMLFTPHSALHAGSLDTSNLMPKELQKLQAIDAGHALRFGTLVFQGRGGRMEPVDTLAHQLLSKISRKNELLGMNADQVLLGMLTEPQLYQKLRMIKITHPLIAKKLGLSKSFKYAAYDDFFDKKTGEYLLKSEVIAASRKRSADRDQYDKDLLKADERVNIMYMIFQGSLLKIYPLPGDVKQRWFSPLEAIKSFPPRAKEVVQLLTTDYFRGVEEGIKTDSWKHADNALDLIKRFQYAAGKEVIPSQKRIEMEIAYNKFQIFDRLVPIYILVGLLLLILAFVHIIKPQFSLKWPVRLSLAVLIAAFAVHTIGLILRWYIAGHAPWSNAYESILFIAWATALAGFVFSRRSPLTLAATSVLAGIFLFVAYLNWLDPQITNLSPVLKSYWLMIHVAVITSSYGFLGLGALLGILVLLLFVFRGKEGNPNIDRAIKELTIINEMTLLIGLAMITVGNFLGGVWANESWGRYWGWDPKETWAAVTILVYAAVVHLRFIPKLKGIYAFNVASVLAYSSVIMTYFGVNYYLSGMHSYAAGDPVPIPAWVWPAIASIFVLIALAARNRKIG